jgi:zinc transporter 9
MAWLSLVVMSVSMFLGTLLIGQLPLAFKMSQSKQKALSLFGIGLLLGAALSVVIPEGQLQRSCPLWALHIDAYA